MTSSHTIKGSEEIRHMLLKIIHRVMEGFYCREHWLFWNQILKFCFF